MADLSDVENALVTLAAQTLYPNGTGQASLPGMPIKVFPGWPIPQQLDADLAAGKCQVSVFTRQEQRNTTRYTKDWQPLSTNAPTLTLTIVGQTVTVGGSVPVSGNPQNVMVMANGKPYVYAIQQGVDTLNSIATALATLIAAGIAGTTNTGAVITLPNTARINAVRVGATGTSIREIRRQEQLFQVSVWADTPAHRDAIVAPLDAALAATQFITLADQSAARLIYKSTMVFDQYQKEKLYRRDLFYTVEYATTQVETDTQITQEQLNASATPDGATITNPVITVYS